MKFVAEDFVGIDPSLFPLVRGKRSLYYFVCKQIYRTLRENEFNRRKTSGVLRISDRTIRNYIVVMRAVGWHIPEYKR